MHPSTCSSFGFFCVKVNIVVVLILMIMRILLIIDIRPLGILWHFVKNTWQLRWLVHQILWVETVVGWGLRGSCSRIYMEIFKLPCLYRLLLDTLCMHRQTCLWLLFYLHRHVIGSMGFLYGLNNTLCYGFNDTNGLERCSAAFNLVSLFWSIWLRTFKLSNA